MRRFILLAVVFLSFPGASVVRGQGSDEFERLKKEIELLQAKLEAANLKVEKLQAEVKQLRAGNSAGKDEESKKPSLSDRLPDGASIVGTYLVPGPGGVRGTATLTITERDGNKVKGKYTARQADAAGTFPGWAFEGEIAGNRLNAKSVGAAAKRTLTMSLSGNKFEGSFLQLDTRVVVRVAFVLEK